MRRGEGLPADVRIATAKDLAAPRCTTAFRIPILALAWLVAGLTLAAGSDTAPPATSTAQELDEVLVEGERRKPRPPSFKDYQRPMDFLARLVGHFVVDGQVDLLSQGGHGGPLKVSGRAECIGFGLAPGVMCELKIRWPEALGSDGEAIPGGVPNLYPAVAMFGYEPAVPGLSWILVDNQGMADTAVGTMESADTMQSRSKCLGIPGNCERVAAITAWSDLRQVDIKIDLVVDDQKAVSYLFVLHRVPGMQSTVYGRKQGKKK